MSGEKVLVLNSTGKVGTQVVEQLVAKNFTVRINIKLGVQADVFEFLIIFILFVGLRYDKRW